METVQDLIDYLEQYKNLPLDIQAPCVDLSLSEFTEEHCGIFEGRFYIAF